MLPTNKKKMYIIGDTIRISYGELIDLDDNVLQTSIFHEIGHYNNLSNMLLITISTSITITVLLLFTPIILFPFILSFSYLVLCYIARLGEYYADRYALSMTSKKDMVDFINSMNKDCNNIFYPFRFHPSNKKRILHLRRFNQ